MKGEHLLVSAENALIKSYWLKTVSNEGNRRELP